MKFKQVLAGLLVGTMVVTSAPVSGLGALSALAASEEAETKNYNYTKLTEGLTASADCANGTNTMNAVLNGNPDDYWHSAWEGDNQPVKQGGEVIMNSNNNITLTLTEASTVKKLEYVSNGETNNGTITKCNVYYKTSAENAEFKKVQEDPYTLSFTESKATIEFTDAISDVKEIKIEVLNTAGAPNNTYISGIELYVYRDDSTKIDSGNILAKAECSSQGDAALKNLVDNNEATGYHSSWGGNGGTVAADEGFTEIVRPGTMTTPTELISRNNLYINLAGSETIGKIAYLPRQGSGNGVANGRITAANIYISNADVNDVSAITDWKQVATADWENNSDEKNVTFSPETAKHIRIEVKHSAGDQTDAYINAAAIDIYKAEEVVAEDKVISKPVLTAVAPVTGETPADVTAAEPEGYTVATAWADSDGNTVTEFEDGKDYTLTATLTAEKGYKFTDESKPSTIKVGEEDLEVTAEVKDSGKTMTLTLVFSVPAESEARKALAAALADAEKVESADKYTEDSYKVFEEALAAANAVTDETSDADVRAAATALENAIKGLKKAETPAPPVTEDSVITAPRLSYTAPVAGETAVVPSYVAMEDQSAKPATLEVKDDVPTTVVVDGGVLAFQGRLTAPNNGANNDKFDVSGDTPMVLRTKVKLKNKTDEVVNILGKMDSQYGIQVDGANDRVILYCCDAQGKWPEVQYKYDADTFWGEWHDIALVYTGTNMQLYVDGKAGEATPGRVNASDGYQVVFKSYASSIFTIGYNTEKSTNHEADGNGVKYSTLDQVDGKIADIKLYKGTDYSEGLTKSYDEIKAALEKVAPDADISAIPYTAVTTWSANGTALEKDAKFAGETVYTATTVYTARSGFKFTDISKPSVDGATVTIAADGKTMTVTKTFPRTAKIVCSCVVGEITGVADQTIDLGVADSKTVTLSAKAQVTGDCKVEGHDGTVNYTYTVTDAGTTGATVKDNAVTVTAAGTAKVKVTATLASDATKTSTKEITLTVTTNKASAQDKADLAAAINAVKDIKEADYTEESYAPLKTALATADTLSKDANASKSDIAAAIQAISDAKKGLKTKVAAKKEELNSLLTAVYDDLMKNGNTYTVASYNNAVTVYKAVKDLPGKDGVTVAELEKAIKDLNDAKDALVLQETADLEKAKENAANTLKDAAAIADAGQKDYEEASWKVFDAAYKALKNAPADADKATLESLTLALRNAQAALKKAETPAVALDAPKVKAAKAKVTKTGVVVNVTVEAVKDAASYDVYRVVKGKATKVGTTAAGKTTVKDKKAVKGASYYAVAVSKDGKVVSKAGAAVAVKLAKAPKIQKATAGSKNAKLSWKKVKGAKVVVYRSTKKNSGYRKVATTRKNATSVTNKKGLKAGKTYYYKIATIKGKLISAMSKAKRVKIKK